MQRINISNKQKSVIKKLRFKQIMRNKNKAKEKRVRKIKKNNDNKKKFMRSFQIK